MKLVARHAGRDGTWDVADAQPGAALRPGVRGYRGFRFGLDHPRRRLEVPVGVVTIMLNFGPRLRLGDPLEGAGAMRPYASLVAGLRTRATLGEHDGRLHGIEIVLEPWAAFTLFDIPLRELGGSIVDAADLLDTRLEALVGALAAIPDWGPRFALLDAVLTRWWTAGPSCSPQVVRAWQLLTRTGGTIPVSRLADDVNWSERQLERRFDEQIGRPPKTAARILRFQRALRRLAVGQPAGAVAAACGYCDQSHLSREVAAMADRTVSRLLVEHRAHHAGPLVLQRVAGEVTSVPVAADVGFLQDPVTASRADSSA